MVLPTVSVRTADLTIVSCGLAVSTLTLTLDGAVTIGVPFGSWPAAVAVLLISAEAGEQDCHRYPRTLPDACEHEAVERRDVDVDAKAEERLVGRGMDLTLEGQRHSEHQARVGAVFEATTAQVAHLASLPDDHEPRVVEQRGARHGLLVPEEGHPRHARRHDPALAGRAK